MKAFQTIKIILPESLKKNFFSSLIHDIKISNWKLRDDLIHNYKNNSFASDKDVLCVESRKYIFKNKEVQGLVWMWDYDGYYEVFNVIPVLSNKLEIDEYNYLVNKFFDSFIFKLADRYNANVTISKPEKFIIDTIGDDAFNALKRFSNTANKSSGNSNPFDFEKWCEFIFIIFRRDIEIDASELIDWLIENGWSNDMAYKLGLDFEYSINLLGKYEQH